MSEKLWRVDSAELEYVKEAIEKGLTGELTKRFEAKFAERFGVEYAIALNSGTSALHAGLLALEVGPGDEVIVPPLTFIAAAFAAMYVGAVPVFADVAPDTFNIDPEDIKKRITSRTKAIVTVSIFGLPPEMDAIMEIAREHNLKVIEDNAQCYLGEYKGKLAGTMGDLSIFSLQRSKHLTTGDGGVVITDDEQIAVKVRKFMDLGYMALTAKPVSNENFKETIQNPNYKRHEFLGFNFRIPEVCSAMGLAQLEKIDMLVEKRIAIAEIYAEAVAGCDWLRPQASPEHMKHSWWTFVVKLDPNAKCNWQEFRQSFREHGGDRFYACWSLSYLEPALEGLAYSEHNIRYEKGLCPVAESLQPYLIQFKTNFESLGYAHKQAEALKKTIANFS